MNNKGFTLIELVVVIVILGILASTALPKFINLSEDAYIAKAQANAAALKSGVQLTNMKWRVLGSPADVASRNDIQLYGNTTAGQIDINAQGFPAQSYNGSDSVLTTNNDDDCLSLWQVLIQDGTENAAINSSADFIVNYESNGDCSYKLTQDTDIGFLYTPTTGEVKML